MTKTLSEIKAFVFDMDGTLVDSGLDFDLMREELNFPLGVPILEHLALIECSKTQEKAHEIIHRHEQEGAKRSTLMPGVKELLEKIKEKNFFLGLLTRNSKEVTSQTLNKFSIHFDLVLTRDDCAPKPEPEGLVKMQDEWKISPKQMLYVGDFRFDLETAKNAGSYSALYLNHKNTHLKSLADFHISDYHEFLKLI